MEGEKTYEIGYAIVEDPSPQGLAMKVQQLSAQGFEPVGGVAVVGDVGVVGPAGRMFYQTMFLKRLVQQPSLDTEETRPRLVTS